MTMSLKRNIISSYTSQIYVTLIGIVLIPLYVQYMGTEAYGLVGFFAMLQAWFNLLDLGLTPTIARESARYHGAAMSALDYRRLYRSLSLVFISIALAGGGGLFLMADAVTNRWLNIGKLPTSEVLVAVQIMAVCVALRWMGGLYRGVVTGSERLVWLSGFNAFVATLRFLGVFGSMWVWGFTPIVFFWHQLAVAAVEVIGLLAMCNSLLPSAGGITERIGWSSSPIKPLLKFSLTIAFTSSVWVLVTQTDKLILSGILPLAEYGYFTLAVLVAGGITIVITPISTVLLPRMAMLQASGNHSEVLRLYNDATQLVSAIAGSLAVTLIVCGESLLYAWSGDRQLATAAAPILKLYAAGNGLLALGAFPFYLQYARGNLHYHLIGNLFLIALLIPFIVLAATYAGGVGAGWVWVAMNMIYLIFWVTYVHKKLEPGLQVNWLFNKVILIFLPIIIAGSLMGMLHSNHESRAVEFFYTGFTGAVCVCIATLASPLLRHAIMLQICRLKTKIISRSLGC